MDARADVTARDRASMSSAFDLGDYSAVREHAGAILEQVATGRMPCYGTWPQYHAALLRRWMDSGTAP